MRAASHDAIELMHNGILALSRVEQNGIAVNTKLLEKTITQISVDMSVIRGRLQRSDIWRVWSKQFGSKSKLSSGEQLGSIVFDKLKLAKPTYTEKGSIVVDSDALAHIDHPFISDWSRLAILAKLNGTYLTGIKRETINGLIHPVFNLHIARSYRSSSDSPNFQNLPVRNAESAKIIRSLFIPRDDSRRLLEIDFGGIEVKVAACYHKDPTMLKYIRDPSTDMHRDMAIECFKLQGLKLPEGFWKSKEPDNNGHTFRYCAKNMFVFPQFYGDFFINNAQQLWRAAELHKLKINGKSIFSWLRHKGIRELGSIDPEAPVVPGTFTHHLKAVEANFWGERFPVYNDWKRKWHNKYMASGGFDMLSGFRVDGVYTKKEVINYPVQGSAFHCLLWCLIRLQRWLNRNGMKSLIVGQIHDSIVLDVTEDEYEEVLSMAHEIMTVHLPRRFPWIIVPMEVEAELTPQGGSWYEKKVVKIGRG